MKRILNIQFDVRRINHLKESLFRLRHEESPAQILAEWYDMSMVEALLIMLELLNGDYGVTMEDVGRFTTKILPQLYVVEKNPVFFHPSHPVQIFKEENHAIEFVLNEIKMLLESIEEDADLLNESVMMDELQRSIGRNVANCHLPKNLKKVMTLIRDLKTGRRTSESMWFKKKDEYVYITYKAIFNDEGEFLGILEYVQNTQSFFELPSEVKMGLTRVED